MELNHRTELEPREQAVLARLGVRLWHDWNSDRVCIQRAYWEGISPDVRNAIAIIVSHLREGQEHAA